MGEVGPWLKAHLVLVYGFLYLPIVVLFGMSFNASGLPTAWGGFTFGWYRELVENQAILSGARTSILIALGATAVATIIGTLLAVGLERVGTNLALDAVVLAPAIVPDIVLAISLLAFYTLISFTLGTVSVLLAHVLFNIAFVAAIVRVRLHNLDPAMEEASMDLGAGELKTFFGVTLPLILPGVMAGALLAFTLSLDEFVLAFFTAGPTTQTLPIVIYGMVRFGVPPSVNALAVVLIGVSFTLIIASQRLTRTER